MSSIRAIRPSELRCIEVAPVGLVVMLFFFPKIADIFRYSRWGAYKQLKYRIS